MQREFLQEKSLNSSQDNAEKSFNVDLSAKSRLIPYSTASGMLGLNDLYTEERDACENYRMIFTVNPICTNVIFNAVTEPVYKEGSYSAVCLVESAVSLNDTKVFPNGTISASADTTGNTYDVDNLYAVRNTEFSHEKIGNFKYHCGYDIFNNHLLRTLDFDHAKIATTGLNKKEFNTIFDFAIDYSGNPVQRDIMDSQGPSTSIIKDNIRMYQLDNINSMNTAFYERLRTVDGWYGFYNTGYINIPNGTLGEDDKAFNVSVNKILNNETSCSFIDLYPDRSLYSFIPKVNRYKKRLERNWDCTIVYPYESDYETFNKVMMNFVGNEDDWSSLKEEVKPYAVRVLHADVKYNNVGDEIIEIHSLLRHTLTPGDEIRLLYAEEEVDTASIYYPAYSEIERFSVPVRVISVGDANGNNEDRCFNIKFNDLATFAEIYTDDETNKKYLIKRKANNIDSDNKPLIFFYKKIENGYDDRYYFRKFKKLKNYEYYPISNDEIPAGTTPVLVTKEPPVVNENSPEYIILGGLPYKRVAKELSYTQNKIAFAENIFGDRVAQVIFNDDICISGLKDNLGRPLSTVYFAAVKTNRGHEEWYNSGNTSGDSVEYSHCFGDITSGLDLPDDSGATEFNVRKLYNIFVDECDTAYTEGLEIALSEAPKGSYNGTPMPLESGITLDEADGFDEFFGDVVEFAKADYRETTIEKVYHRFNTAQRECLLNPKYYNIYYDELVGDLYDVLKENDNTREQ